MKRFLLFFSYIGSGFRGLQRQIPREKNSLYAVPTVAEVIESCIKSVLDLRELPILQTASRTDAGVHALKSAGSVDLDIPVAVLDSFVAACNHHFTDISCPVRIISVQRVSDDFNARALPVHRSYLYRFAVIRPNPKFDNIKVNLKHFTPTPITEYLRCYYFVNPKFDIDAVNEVLPLFRGVHDFRTFMGSLGSKKNRDVLEKDLVTVRELQSIEITPGRPLLPSPLDENFNYWNFSCSGKSFLYKQVRRMVSALLCVGDGTLSSNDVKYMFDNPASTSWNPRCRSAPAHGLYLSDVVYKDEDLIPPAEDTTKSSDLKTSPKDVVGLTISEKINLRLEKIKLQRLESKIENETNS